MKLKTIALAMLLSAAGGAYASPAMQSCSPMEVVHDGVAGISYNLKCEAGSWALNYHGSVPAGTDSVMARYKLDVHNPDGSNFSLNRTVRLPSPAMLGQALLREAVLLDSGDVALRDCEDFSCTLYRPLGSTEKLSKATITVTPEMKRLSDDANRLSGELAHRQADLAAQTAKVAALEAQVRDLSAKLAGSDKSRTDAQAALATAKEESKADLQGLVGSSAAQISGLTDQLNTANATLAQVRKDFAACEEAHQAAQAAKAKADAEVEARGRQVADLQAQLTAVTSKLNASVTNADAEAAALSNRQVQAGKSEFANLALLRLKADSASGEVQTLTSKVDELQRALTEANAKLFDAQTAQRSNDTIRAAAAAGLKSQRSQLETALADAKQANIELTSAHSGQVAELQASLSAANDKLSATQAQFNAYVAAQSATQAQQKLSSIAQHAELDDLRAQLSAAVSQVADQAKQLTQAQAALTKAQQAGGAVGVQTGNADAGLTEQLAKATAERDSAKSEVADLTQKLADVQPQLDQMRLERDDMAKRAKEVAKEMLTALDKLQALQNEKAEEDKVLQDTTNKVMDLSTKLQAANLARELAMQAATTANADTDNQHLQNKQLALQLSRAQAQITSLSAERDDLSAKLQASAQNSTAAPVAAPVPVVSAPISTKPVTAHERDLREESEAKQHYIDYLRQTNADQAKQLATLRAELAIAKNAAKSTSPDVASAVK